jgi:hypothetical protein
VGMSNHDTSSTTTKNAANSIVGKTTRYPSVQQHLGVTRWGRSRVTCCEANPRFGQSPAGAPTGP